MHFVHIVVYNVNFVLSTGSVNIPTDNPLVDLLFYVEIFTGSARPGNNIPGLETFFMIWRG